jgi:hypothetical protein
MKKSCGCKKHQVAGLEDANWMDLGYSILGGAAGQLVNGALNQIEPLDGKNGMKAGIKAVASVSLIAFAEGEWSTPFGSGMLVETGVTFLRESDILSDDADATAGLGRVFTY